MTDLILMVRALPFGGHLNGRDRHKTFFTQRTDFGFDRLPLPMVLRRHGWAEARPRPIGRVLRAVRARDGVWFETALTRTADNLRLYALAQRGQLYASSGAVAHLVRIAPSGEVLEWPVVEFSLLELREQPSNLLAVALPQAHAA